MNLLRRLLLLCLMLGCFQYIYGNRNNNGKRRKKFNKHSYSSVSTIEHVQNKHKQFAEQFRNDINSINDNSRSQQQIVSVKGSVSSRLTTELSQFFRLPDRIIFYLSDSKFLVATSQPKLKKLRSKKLIIDYHKYENVDCYKVIYTYLYRFLWFMNGFYV